MLGKTDPRTKLLALTCLSTLAVVAGSWQQMLCVTLLGLLTVWQFGVQLLPMLRRLRVFLRTMLLLAAVQCLFVRTGSPLLGLGNVTLITTGGLDAAATFALRLSVIIFAATILWTASHRELIEALVRCRVPYSVAFASLMGLRQLPLLRRQFADAVTALELRGVDLAAQKPLSKVRLIATLLSPTVAAALVGARKTALAIQLRGFGAYPRRSSIVTLRLRTADYITMTLTLLVTLAMVWLMMKGKQG